MKSYPPLGALLREWRAARRMSQLDLALESGMSARHLGFVEVGKAKPTRQAIVRLAAALSLPLRERNVLLLAAGYAPEFGESDFANPELERMRVAVDLILEHQEPFPAFVLNRHFDVLLANAAAARLNDMLLRGQKSRHSNLLLQIFDPEDFRRVIANWPEVAASFLRRLHEQIAAAPGDTRSRALLDELLTYPDVPPEWRHRAVGHRTEPVVMLIFESPMGRLRFFETITTFAAPLDVTLDELCIDCAFPADVHTAEVCRKLSSES